MRSVIDNLTSQIQFTKTAQKTENARLLGAFPFDDRLCFRLEAPRALGLFRPQLALYRDDDGQNFSLFFERTGLDFETDRFELSVSLRDLCCKGCADGLFWYTVICESGYGRLRISCSHHSYLPVVTRWDAPYCAYQLTIYQSDFHTPDAFKGGILYHIFVDRFARGGKVPVREDALLNEDWENGIPQYAETWGGFVKNNQFFGGTLYGVVDKLDYLSSLGVTTLYLSPIFEAYSNHKYDTGNYFSIDPMFGGLDAFEKLVQETQKRGMTILLDGVFNHTGDDSVYFNKYGRYDSQGAYQSRNSPYYSWFDFQEYPDKYRCWWDIPILPAVTTTDPSYVDFVNGEKGVVAHYIQKGISGWRLDVADELDSSFLESLRRATKTANPNAILYGEVWEDASEKVAYGKRRRYFRGDELDSVMNYPLREGIIRFVRDGDWNALFEASAFLYSHYPKETSDCLMNLLGTHDTERILTVLAGDLDNGRSPSELSVAKMTQEQREIGKKRLKLCFLLSATLPGIPCIYYGDEVGMEGYRDPFNRMPFPWGREDSELLDFYRKIGEIRRQAPIFEKGYLEVEENTPPSVFAFSRFTKEDRLLVVVNQGKDSYFLKQGGVDLLTGKSADHFWISPESALILSKIR
jgi:glycosidase